VKRSPTFPCPPRAGRSPLGFVSAVLLLLVLATAGVPGEGLHRRPDGEITLCCDEAPARVVRRRHQDQRAQPSAAAAEATSFHRAAERRADDVRGGLGSPRAPPR
jgi:hypothetical protein